MKKMLNVSAALVFALAMAAPAFAGGSHCSGEASATTAEAHGSCSGKAMNTAWAGAWLQRSMSGQLTVADVSKGSPAARSGLKKGDVVLAVNGYDLSKSEDRAMCASKSECSVGSAVTYKVQRGSSTKTIKLKLEKMPSNATERYPNQKASFDPTLAAVVLPSTTN